MKLFQISGFWSALRALLGWPLIMVGLYFISALIGSIVPANNAAIPSKDGVDIFVETNGVHVSLVLPMVAVGEDITDIIRPEHLTDPNLFGTHAMIGWGHGAVYRNARTWNDVRSGDVASAVFGSDFSTLHVYHLINPQPTSYRKQLRVNAEQYHKIIKQVRATFRLNKYRESTHYPGYSANNLFYDSYGRYSAVNTCNVWTGKVLRNAGVRIGIWTPLAGGVMRWF